MSFALLMQRELELIRRQKDLILMKLKRACLVNENIDNQGSAWKLILYMEGILKLFLREIWYK